RVQVVPVREDGVEVACARQAAVGEDREIAAELQCAVGVHIRSSVGLVVQRVRERQRDGGRAVVAMIAGVYRTRYDTAPYLCYVVMVLRRATLYRVSPREGRVRIASFSSDRPGPNARRHAASEVEVHGERSCASIDRHSGDTAANIAGQGQITCLD